jgi:hypothetical protein
MVDLNIKNFLIVTVIAIVGIVLFKVAVNKVPIRGISDVVNAV